MPTITDFSTVEFVDVLAMKLERPSLIVRNHCVATKELYRVK